ISQAPAAAGIRSRSFMALSSMERVMEGGRSRETLDRRPVHQTAARQRVIRDGEVLRQAVVPHEQVADAPTMAVDEARLRAVLDQVVPQRERLLVGHAL